MGILMLSSGSDGYVDVRLFFDALLEVGAASGERSTTSDTFHAARLKYVARPWLRSKRLTLVYNARFCSDPEGWPCRSLHLLKRLL